MNKFFAIGNLTREPELSELDSGVSICRFTLAVNRPRADSDGKKTDFFRVTCFRVLAENVAKYCRKGHRVCVVGELSIRNYTDNDGNLRTSVEVAASDVEFLTSKAEAGTAGNNAATSPVKEVSKQKTTSKGRPTMVQEEFNPDDIPF